MDGDTHRTVDFVELLVEPCPADGPRWARALLLRILEMHGSCRYRYDRLTGKGPATAAALSLREAYRLLDPLDRRLFTRLMLVVPWEGLRRETGLGLRIRDVVQILSVEAGAAECVEAAREVVTAGWQVVNQFPLEGVLVEERAPGSGLTFHLPAAVRNELGLTSGTFTVDRVQSAVRGYHGLGWGPNLRAIVPWWLDALDSRDSDRAIALVLRRAGSVKEDPDAAQYCLLGIADWMTSTPQHLRSGEVLDLCLSASVGAVRRTAADLASAMGRTEILESLAASDPDRSVRRRAERLLGSR